MQQQIHKRTIVLQSPAVIRELLVGGDEALARLRSGHATILCAANLSSSCLGPEVDGIRHTPADYARLTDGLLTGTLRQRLRG